MNNVQNFYKPLIVKWVAFCVSARLTFLGNIRHPMELRQLGKLLSCHHFVSVRVHGGIRGFFVIEHTHNQADARKIVEQYNQERDTF